MKIRNKKEIRNEEEKLSELAWFYRFTCRCLLQKLNPEEDPRTESARQIVNKYEAQDLITSNQQLCETYGKISALRWVMGESWDNMAVL